jgi:dienelactone hydrolase
METPKEEPRVISAPSQPLAGTAPLTLQGDIASQMVEGIDRFLLQEIESNRRARLERWKTVDTSSPERYTTALVPYRQRLAHILGIRDARIPFESPELISTLQQESRLARSAQYEVHAVRWHVLTGVESEGLLLKPTKGAPRAYVVALPDCNQTPEDIAGLNSALPLSAQYARTLAEQGCLVLIPALIPRTEHPTISKLTYREYLYRSAFELGRHLLGYEVQKALAAVDWFTKQGATPAKIAVIGWGEGGLIALSAGAYDTRIGNVCVKGYLNEAREYWNEPIDRNVFDRDTLFGDAELASMILPRNLILETGDAPEQTLAGGRGAPAKLPRPAAHAFDKGFAQITALGQKWGVTPTLHRATDRSAEKDLLNTLGIPVQRLSTSKPPTLAGKAPNAQERTTRLVQQIDEFNQSLLRKSASVRTEYMKSLDTSSLDAYTKSVEAYRQKFANEVIGRFNQPLLPPQPRTRLAYDAKKWRGYEVTLEVFPNVFAYGILLLPKDLQPNEKRPVVVCQHGLEGRPQDTIGKANFAYYKAFAAGLANRGYITFAPQNIYIFEDRFRNLQRKANPLGKTLFSIMVPQHQQITDWLKTLPNVDPNRIAFYGLSYGGKSAMRIPPLVSNYCLSICSADFNEWVWKNSSTHSNYSYVFSGEYEIFEFDLGSTFNYAEMAALIAPRPFMVERGQFDGVSSDEAVSYEYAKVRFLYQAKLGIGDRTEIEYFVGPHSINSRGTFDFLDRHLHWKPQKD